LQYATCDRSRATRCATRRARGVSTLRTDRALEAR
jgi:hypothetical protein